MNSRVIGVLAGQDFPLPRLLDWAKSADAIYVADSAANRLIPHGFEPVVVGDLDSVDHDLIHDGLRIVRDQNENLTDCDKLLQLVTDDGHDHLTLLGVEGDEVDHILSTWSSLIRSTLTIRVILRKSVGYVLREKVPVEIPSVTGRRISLIPLLRCENVNLSGVVWPLDDATIEPGGHLSVSNKGEGNLFASIGNGTAILFVESFTEEEPFW